MLTIISSLDSGTQSIFNFTKLGHNQSASSYRCGSFTRSVGVRF